MWLKYNNRYRYVNKNERVLAESDEQDGLWSAVVHYHRHCKTNIGEYSNALAAMVALDAKMAEDKLPV